MDQNNIGLAALRMNESLGITPEDFANISSIFFISYLIFHLSSIGFGKSLVQENGLVPLLSLGSGNRADFFAKRYQHILLALAFLGI